MEPDELESLNHTLDILVEEMTAKARQTAAEQKAKKKRYAVLSYAALGGGCFLCFLTLNRGMVTGADVPVMLVLMGMILCAGLLGLTFYYGFKYRSADSLQKAAESMADPVRARQIAIAQARDQAIKHQMQAR